MAGGTQKSEGALKTISEVSDQFGIPQHILRYWETRFPQLRPLQRAGNRRYYRAEDVALVARIDALLNREGYTIKGVQKLLSERGGAAREATPPPPQAAAAPVSDKLISELRAIRQGLAAALQADLAA
jgi:DNA-binding transcriptional MerR regulator